MSLYAANTSVPVDRSRGEIERLIRKYGASRFVSGWDSDSGQAVVEFQFGNMRVRFGLPMPKAGETFTQDRRSHSRRLTGEESREQEERRRWRALGLLIKAKLEAVASKITVFEEEFLAHLVVKGNRTVGALLLPTLADSLNAGKLPPLLPGIGETGKGSE